MAERSTVFPPFSLFLWYIDATANNLEPALQLYQKAVKGGIERAEQNVRSVSIEHLGSISHHFVLQEHRNVSEMSIAIENSDADWFRGI